MLKGGMLSAPVIQPLRCNQSVGTRLKVCPNTYIQIKTGITQPKMAFEFVIDYVLSNRVS